MNYYNKLNWQGIEKGHQVRAFFAVDPGLTDGKVYCVEDLTILGRDGDEALMVVNDTGERRSYLLDRFEKVDKPIV